DVFFQAEDGIRARNVTGVQTCALPISLLDRFWGVLQADEAPTRIQVEDVTWPATDPTHSPRVQFAESDLAWGAKLLAMMIEVRDELRRQPATPDLSGVEQMITRLQNQLETMEQQSRS